MNHSETKKTEAEQMHETLRGLKEGVDFLVNQLTRGSYLSTSTFANNLLHLNRAFAPVQVRMTDPGVVEMLLHKDILLAADLIATGRAIAMMNNFLVCVTGQTADGLPVEPKVML